MKFFSHGPQGRGEEEEKGGGEGGEGGGARGGCEGGAASPAIQSEMAIMSISCL